MIMDEALPSLKVAFIFMFLSLLTGNAVLFFKNWKKSAIQQEELKRAHLALQYLNDRRAKDTYSI